MKKAWLSKQGWHYKLLKASYEDPRIPQNLCPYFWGTIFRLVLLPLTWVGYIAQKMTKGVIDYFAKFLGTLFFYILWLGGIGVAVDLFFKEQDVSIWMLLIVGLACAIIPIIILVLMIVLLAALGQGFFLARDKTRVLRGLGEHEKSPTLFGLWIRARYHKICPRIIWYNK